LETKTATRQRILDVSRRLVAESGFEATTTRDIAQAAEIGTGPLFNYFATKEAIMACLASEAATGAHQEFERKALDAESFEEDLFAFVAESTCSSSSRTHASCAATQPLSASPVASSEWHQFCTG
jgi:AcrR family transcriptional regulator